MQGGSGLYGKGHRTAQWARLSAVRARWKISFDNHQGANIYHRSVFPILHVKMRRWMIGKVHPDYYPEETADLRHVERPTPAIWERVLRASYPLFGGKAHRGKDRFPRPRQFLPRDRYGPSGTPDNHSTGQKPLCRPNLLSYTTHTMRQRLGIQTRVHCSYSLIHQRNFLYTQTLTRC